MFVPWSSNMWGEMKKEEETIGRKGEINREKLFFSEQDTFALMIIIMNIVKF